MFKAQIIYSEIDNGFSVRLTQENQHGVACSVCIPRISDRVYVRRADAEKAARNTLRKLAA